MSIFFGIFLIYLLIIFSATPQGLMLIMGVAIIGLMLTIIDIIKWIKYLKLHPELRNLEFKN